MTNGDLIRSLNNEEMASAYILVCPRDNKIGTNVDRNKCLDGYCDRCISNWVNQEIETTTVFRIAFDDISAGLWYNKPEILDLNVIGALKMLEESYPMPYDEKIPKNYLCCCPSFEALNEYFGDYLQHLLDVGFRIHVYEIPWEYVRTYETHLIADFSKGVSVKTIEKGDSPELH